MKHIKVYNSFASLTYKLFESSESPEEIIQYLKDIFQDIIDNGFIVRIDDTSYNGDYTKINVEIHKYKETAFWLTEIKDAVESSIDYMNSIGVNYLAASTNKGPNWKVNWNNGDYPVVVVDIIYKSTTKNDRISV